MSTEATSLDETTLDQKKKKNILQAIFLIEMYIEFIEW